MRMPTSPWILPTGVLAVALLASGCALFRGEPGQESGEALDIASQRALEYLPDDETLHWVDPETEQPSQVTVLQTLPAEDGQVCRLLHTVSGERPGNPVDRFCRDSESGAWLFERRLSTAEAEAALATDRSEAGL
jgi:hypothetical protein